MSQRPLILLAGLFVFAGCNKDGQNNDDTGTTPDDTGDAWYEEGCILIEGGRSEGYALIADALTVAEDGDTLDLSACESMDQAAEVGKSVTIKGPGADLLTWTAPTNEAAVKVAGASDVRIEGFTLLSERNGIELTSASNVSIDGVVFDSIANTALKSTDSTGVSVSNATFTAPGYGAIEVSGGSITLSDSQITDALGFAIHAIEGAQATATNNTITGVSYTELDENGSVSDGFAFWGENADFVTENNVMTNNFVHVLVDTGDVVMTGDALAGGLYGVYAVFGSADLEGVTVTDAVTVGALLVSTSDDISVVDSSFTTDPAIAFDSYDDPEAWSGGGLIAETDGAVTIDNVTVSGWNAQGVAVGAREDSVTADISGLTVTDCGRYGVRLLSGDFVVTDTWVEQLRLADNPELVNVGGSLSVGYGVQAFDADVDWTGGGIVDSAVTSATIQNSNWRMEGAEVSNGGWDGGGTLGIGLWGLSSTLDISNTTFSKSPNYGGIANYFGTLIADGLVFEDNTWEYSYDSNQYQFYGTGGNATTDSTTFTSTTDLVAGGLMVGDLLYMYSTYEYLEVASITSGTEVELVSPPATAVTDSNFAVYRPVRAYAAWYSVDVVSNGAISTEISNSTFTTGSDGIQIIGGDSDVTLSNLSFTDYNDSVLYIYRSDTDPAYGDIEVSDLSVSNLGYTALRCSGATVEVDGLSVSGTMQRTSQTRYEAADGTEISSSTYNSSGVAAIYNQGCDLSLDEVTVSGADYHSLLSTGGSLELNDVTVSEGSSKGSSSYAAVDVSWGDESPVLLASGLEISSTGSSAMSIKGNGQTGSVALSGVSIDDAAGVGLTLMDMGQASISGLSVSGSSSHGVQNSGDLTLSGAILSGNAGYGFWSGQDADGDGYTVADGDCNDFDSGAYPGASESTYSYEDLNCDGLSGSGTWTTSDIDGDGYGVSDGDCDEYNAARNPGGTDTPGIDGDCDGVAGALSGSVVLSGGSYTGNTLGGVYLGGFDADVDSNTITGNSGYGMVCDASVSFDSCDSNDLSGNGSGTTDGCSACEL